MSTAQGNEELSFGDAAEYRLVVAGAVTPRINEWLGDHRVEASGSEQEPTTTIQACVHDQAELNGLLNTLYELHLTILSMQRITAEQQPNVSGDQGRTISDTTN